MWYVPLVFEDILTASAVIIFNDLGKIDWYQPPIRHPQKEKSQQKSQNNNCGNETGSIAIVWGIFFPWAIWRTEFIFSRL